MLPTPLFLDWGGLGVDDAGAPVHVPTVEGDMIVCRCHLEDCQLDRALWRAWVVGFMAAHGAGSAPSSQRVFDQV